MNTPVSPLHVNSLKEASILWLEQLILSGELKAGERLPSERDLAAQLGISRPVLHESLVDLAAKGLVTILPRRGVEVNDYRKSGSFAILSSLLMYTQGNLDPELERSLFEMRILLETETARLAAAAASPEEIAELKTILKKEQGLGRSDVPALVALDFDFHLLVSIASGNRVYPLIINSFKSVYIHFTGEFYSQNAGSPVSEQVWGFQNSLIDALQQHDSRKAAETMYQMLVHGEQFVKGRSE